MQEKFDTVWVHFVEEVVFFWNSYFEKKISLYVFLLCMFNGNMA